MTNTTKQPNFFDAMRKAGMDKEAALVLLKLWRDAGLTHLSYRGMDLQLPHVIGEKK